MHQVKFWFQNRRNQMKVQLGRQNNCFLREENVRLRAENELLWETMKKPLCKDCGNPSMEGQRLRAENIRLKEEINRFCSSINGTGFQFSIELSLNKMYDNHEQCFIFSKLKD